MSSKVPKIAVVGATGVVGREILAQLQEANWPGEAVFAFGSERSEGEEVDYASETLVLEKASPEGLRGMELVYLATPPDASLALAKAAQANGAFVVDTSSAFRAEARVPLVFPGVNEKVLSNPFEGRVVSVPSATTAGLLTVVEPLRRALGVAFVHYTAMVPASHWGMRGVTALERQTADLLGGREPEADFVPHRLGFNLLPQVGPFEDSLSLEERAVLRESQRLWSGQSDVPAVSGTVVQAPTFYGTCLSVSIQFSKSVTLEAVRKAFDTSKAVKLLDAPAEGIYPMPMLVTADPTVHVGRLRLCPGNWLQAFVAFDNAGFGAARQAVTVGQMLLNP